MKELWVFGDLRSPRIWQDSLQVMEKGRAPAEEAGAAVVMVLLGASGPDTAQAADLDLGSMVPMETATQDALAHGAHAVLCLDHPSLAVPDTRVFAEVLADRINGRLPYLVLFSLNDFNRELAAFCAQRCPAGMIADAGELHHREDRVVGRCPAWGGRILADIALADDRAVALVTVQPHGVTLRKVDRPGDRIERITPERISSRDDMTLVRRVAEPPEARRLEDASVVVVGGAGLGSVERFGLVRDLAVSLGGEVGATRPPVLYHWVEEERLIGQTGKTVRPDLLITVGTSGAVQYTAGILESGTIVAVDRDPNAPIFETADLGVVADAAVILPLLVQEARQRVMRRLTDAASSTDGAPQGGFGDMVRRLREARGWSRADLARKTGQTPDFVEQLELDRMSPPVGFILTMARAMEVDPGTFLHKEEQTALRDRRAQAFQQRTQSYSYTTLTPNAEDAHLKAFMITIEPHLAHKPVAYKHEGEEFIFVMEGELEFTLGARSHVLKAGESIHFNSDVPHKLKSLSSEPTQCLVVLYTL